MDKSPAHQANPMLAQMKDIMLPPEVPAWPPAPWVWAALIITLVFLAIVIWLWRKRRAKIKSWLAPRDEAMTLLCNLSPASGKFAIELSALLKRASLSYFPRSEVASLTGEAWIQFLNQRLPEKAQGNFTILSTFAYTSKPLAPNDAIELKALAIEWLTHLPRAVKHKLPTGTPDDSGKSVGNLNSGAL